MKDLKSETAKLLARASQNLAQVVASSSFEFWQKVCFYQWKLLRKWFISLDGQLNPLTQAKL